jgi:hypothetical protein
MALTYVSSINSIADGSPKVPTNTHISIAKKPKKANKNTGNNWSASLQVLLHQPPSRLPYFVLLSSIAFFTGVIAWAWTGKILETVDLQGEFVSLKQAHAIQSQSLKVLSLERFKKGEAIVEIAFQDKPLILVATLPDQKVGFINQKDKVQITWDKNFISGTVISILPYAQNDGKLGLTYRVEVALDNYVAENKQPIKLQVGRTGTAKIIHQSHIADILLESIQHLSQSN